MFNNTWQRKLKKTLYEFACGFLFGGILLFLLYLMICDHETIVTISFVLLAIAFVIWVCRAIYFHIKIRKMEEASKAYNKAEQHRRKATQAATFVAPVEAKPHSQRPMIFDYEAHQ